MFKRAERTQAKIKIAITGPSGAGKTYSALRLAKGMGKRIAVIDTENGSASLYSDTFQFDTLEFAPPFTTEKYIEGIRAAEAAGYDVLIIDSITHAWTGEGGLLQEKEAIDARGKGNSYTNWGTITKKHEIFKAAMLHSKMHLIATMRSKQDYQQTEEGGKKKVVKLGLAPQQREGMEYEFTVVFDIAMNHEAEASKDRTGLFTGKYFKITEQIGEAIRDWLASAKAVEATTPELVDKAIQSLRSQTHSEPAEYRIPFGKTMKGKLLSEVEEEEIENAIMTLEDEARQVKTPLGGARLEFVTKARAHLKAIDSGKGAKFPLPPDWGKA